MRSVFFTIVLRFNTTFALLRGRRLSDGGRGGRDVSFPQSLGEIASECNLRKRFPGTIFGTRTGAEDLRKLWMHGFLSSLSSIVSSSYEGNSTFFEVAWVKWKNFLGNSFLKYDKGNGIWARNFFGRSVLRIGFSRTGFFENPCTVRSRGRCQGNISSVKKIFGGTEFVEWNSRENDFRIRSAGLMRANACICCICIYIIQYILSALLPNRTGEIVFR